MSLLDDAFVECLFVDKKHTSDGEGGYLTEWVDGARFGAAITLDQSIQAQRAQIDGVTGIYTVVTRKETRLDYHDVFKRKSDGKVFRVVSKDDNATPEGSTLNARIVKAEEWILA